MGQNRIIDLTADTAVALADLFEKSVAGTGSYKTTAQKILNAASLLAAAAASGAADGILAVQSSAAVLQTAQGLQATPLLVQAETASFNVTAAMAGSIITNLGASGQVIATLPASAVGLNFTFFVAAAQQLRVLANTGDKISVGPVLSAAAGYIQSSIVGSWVYVECVAAGKWLASPTGPWQLINTNLYPIGYTLGVIGYLNGANFNSTADQQIGMAPGNAGQSYYIQQFIAKNASVSMTTARGGIYTAAAKGGTAIIPATQAFTSLTASAIYMLMSPTPIQIWTQDPLYFSLTTAQGAAATADIILLGVAVP